MGWEPWVVVLAGFVMFGAATRGWAWWNRERVVRALSDRPFDRIDRSVTLRVMARGSRFFPGMAPNRTHRSRGDLVLQDGRFVLTSGRGTLLDVKPGSGPTLTSVRSPGPHKLVIEGQVPALEGKVGLFRIEAFLEEALSWVEALQPLVTAEDGARFGSRIPEIN